MLFGKVPEAGRVKTRLTPALGPAGAAELYQAFLDDLVRRTRVLDPGRELWVPVRAGAEERLTRRYGDLRIRWQEGGDLGERLRRAFGAAFAEGAARVLVVGSDHPTLPMTYLSEAFDRLTSDPAVVGPSRDGGYYAIGFRRDSWPRAAALFRGIPWSTPRVLRATRRRARGRALRLSELREWYDVDEPGDLDRLRRDVEEGTATARVLERLEREAG